VDSDVDLKDIAMKLKGYSGCDITNICRSVPIHGSEKEQTWLVGMKAGRMLLHPTCIAHLPSKNARRDGLQWNKSQNASGK
jgi:hypothetical protein